MSQVKLTADSGGGTTSLKAPSTTTGNADVVLKLPVADGSANQVLKTDGSGQLSFTSNAGTTINNNADNRIITGSDTANTLNGEVNLTFDNSNMKLTIGNPAIIQSSSSGGSLAIGGGNTNPGGQILFKGGNTDANIVFKAQAGTSTPAERMRIDSSGRVGIGDSSPDRELVVKNASSNSSIKIEASNAHTSQLFFSDTDAENVARISVFHGAGQATSNSLLFDLGGTTRMAIDSSGRVGIRNTSMSSFNDGGDDLVIGDGTDTQDAGITLLSHSSDNGSIFFNDSVDGNLNGLIQYRHSENAMRVLTNGSERMRIDSSGRLLVDSTSTSIASKVISTIGTGTEVTWSQCGLAVTHASGAGVKSLIGFGFSGNGGTYPPAAIGSFTNSTSGNESNDLAFFTRSATSDTEASERARITADGKFYVGTSNGAFANNASQKAAIVNSAANVYTLSLRNNLDSSNGRGLLVAAGNGGGGRLIFFERFDGSTLGSITVASSSSVSYNTSSDYRLKENVTTITDGITRLKTLKPSRFNWKDDPDTPFDGFIAHEVSSVVPEAITGTKDEVDENNEPVYQGIDQSKLVPLLTAALQEEIAKREALEARVAALEAA